MKDDDPEKSPASPGSTIEGDRSSRGSPDKIEEYDVVAQFLASIAARPNAAELLEPWTPEEEAKVKRKIDTIVMPLLFVSTLMCGTDKVILGTAATFGLQTDLGLKGQEYSWANSMLSLGMIAMMLPQGYIAQRYNLIGKLYAANVIGYGIVLFGMSGVKNAAGLLATRFMLGMFEGGNPILGGLLIAMWWKRDEQNLRAAVIYSTLSSVINGLMSFAMQFYNPGPLSRWRLLFIICACCSCVVGAVGLIFLPNSPTEAWWMTDREKIIAVKRVAENKTGVISHRIKRAQIIEALTDVKTWILFLITVCLNIPNGGLVGFNAIIVNSLGYSIKETTLLTIPTGVISWISALVIATAAQKTRRPLICVVTGILVAMSAVIMLYTIPRSNQSASLGALFLLFTYWGPNVAIGTYVVYANVAGATKKVAVFCIVQFGYCTGNLIAPQTFRAKETPKYPTAITVMLVGYCVAILLLGMYAFLCWNDNRRKDVLEAERIERLDSARSKVATEWMDLTDKQNPTFRYTW